MTMTKDWTVVGSDWLINVYHHLYLVYSPPRYEIDTNYTKLEFYALSSNTYKIRRKSQIDNFFVTVTTARGRFINSSTFPRKHWNYNGTGLTRDGNEAWNSLKVREKKTEIWGCLHLNVENNSHLLRFLHFYIESSFTYDRCNRHGYYRKWAAILTTPYFYIFSDLFKFHNDRYNRCRVIFPMIATVAEHFCSNRNTCRNHGDHMETSPCAIGFSKRRGKSVLNSFCWVLLNESQANYLPLMCLLMIIDLKR